MGNDSLEFYPHPDAEKTIICTEMSLGDLDRLHPSQKSYQELKILIRYAWPLILTYLLQNVLPYASVFSVAHLGTSELGAVSLGTMTANITGYAVYQGFATSLDTLCAQAYGSGNKKLVGVYVQRMVVLLWAITIPIGFIWYNSEAILSFMVPQKEVVRLAAIYLKILLLGAPGWAAFESGKRFVQSQGIFTASLYVLLFVAPLSCFLQWYLVWGLDWGFVGAPVALAITNNLLPVGLVIYIWFIDGKQCWQGLSRSVFENWGPMIRLAVPGFFMVEAELLAFEILTLQASWLGEIPLAAQGILITVATITNQIPMPWSIASATRVANLIGAESPLQAKRAAKTAVLGAVFIGCCNTITLVAARNIIPALFTDNKEVSSLASKVFIMMASLQLVDALADCCNGLLRGIGRQEVGGYVALGSFSLVRTCPLCRSGIREPSMLTAQHRSAYRYHISFHSLCH
jgi:multidrug resistance protein, MATE family